MDIDFVHIVTRLRYIFLALCPASAALRRDQRGNIFAALFGGIAVAGALGFTMMDMIRGPLATSVEVSRRTTTESYIMTSTKLVTRRSAGQAANGDCDTDGKVEPLPWKAAGDDPAPQGDGGGLLPDSIGSSRTDSWGTTLAYCAWDHGARVDDAGCGGASQKRLPGGDTQTETVMALISAGNDQTFQTACNAFADGDNDGEPDTPLVVTPDSSDDIVYTRSYMQAMKGSGGLWKLASDNADTATTEKNAAVGTEGADFDSSMAGVTFANNGLKLGEYNLGLSPPQVPNCDGANNKLMLYDTDASSTVICDGAKSTWSKLSASSSGNFVPIFGYGADASITVTEDSSGFDLTTTLEASDLNTAQTLTWSVGNSPSNGTLNNFPKSKSAGIGVQPPGSPALQYEPDTNYNGSDSFAITLSDGTDSNTLSVDVTVTPQNDAPTFDNGGSTSITLDEDTSTTINSKLSATDVDDNQTLTWSVASAPSNGSLSGFTTSENSGTNDASQTPGGLSYAPDADYNGSDSFDIQIDDSNGGTNTITVNVTVNPVNDAPVASDDGTFTVISHNTSTNDVIANDSDVDGDSLDVAGTTSPSTGTSTHSGDNVTYDPDEGSISGTISDSFDYTAADGNGGTDTATVNYTVYNHHDHSQCYSDDRYWYHSGGGREGERENCGTCCSNDICNEDDGCCNNSRSNVCHNGDVWKQDQCGNMDYEVSSCSCGCSGGSCDTCLTWSYSYEQDCVSSPPEPVCSNTSPGGDSCSSSGAKCAVSNSSFCSQGSLNKYDIYECN